MFKWLKKEVTEEIVKSQIPQKEVDKNDYSGAITDKEFNYLISVLQSDDLRLEKPSGPNFFRLDNGIIFINGFDNNEESICVSINNWKLILNNYQKLKLHKQSLITISRIYEKAISKSHSNARKNLQELMNG